MHRPRIADKKRGKMKFVVELQKGVFLSVWKGDPGRTYSLKNARHYDTRTGAKIGLAYARRFRAFKKAQIVDLRHYNKKGITNNGTTSY